MPEKIEVRSQAEFDACASDGNIAVVINCLVVARGNSSVEAQENSSVEAWGNSSVVARENSLVVARENVFIRLFSALRLSASAGVVILKHNKSDVVTGGRQLDIANE